MNILIFMFSPYKYQVGIFLFSLRKFRLRAVLLSGLFCLHAATASSAETPINVYAPQTVTLKNDTQNLICYLGYSQAGGKQAVPGYGFGPQATPVQNPKIEWNLITDLPKLGSMCQISSYPLPAGGQITIDTAPRVANYQSNYKLINSARTYFYAVSGKSFDKYSFVLKDESGDIDSLPAYTVPYAIAEWSVYPSST